MIYLLLQYLELLGFKIWPVFFYLSTRMILASVTTFLIMLFLGPYFINLMQRLKIQQMLRRGEDFATLEALHGKKKDTPTMGGLLILFSMNVSLFLWMDWHCSFTWIFLLVSLWLGFIGFYDDFLKLKHKNFRGLSAKKKLLFQIMLGALIALYLLVPQVQNFFLEYTHIDPPFAKEHFHDKVVKTLSSQEYNSQIFTPFYKKPIIEAQGLGISFIAIFMIIVLVGSSNAVNITDGLDGLASGLLIFVSAVLAFVAFLTNHSEIAYYLNIPYIEGSSEIAIYLCCLAGGALGFLWYNSYPAQIFMGDTGSLALGGIIGVGAILLKKELLLALVGALFVIEALSVLLQIASYRFRNKKRIFLCAPIHHHYEYKGMPETKVVIRFWIIGLILAVLGLASIKFQ